MAQSLLQHNSVTVYHTVVQFSVRCSERKNLYTNKIN